MYTVWSTQPQIIPEVSTNIPNMPDMEEHIVEDLCNLIATEYSWARVDNLILLGSIVSINGEIESRVSNL